MFTFGSKGLCVRNIGKRELEFESEEIVREGVWNE